MDMKMTNLFNYIIGKSEFILTTRRYGRTFYTYVSGFYFRDYKVLLDYCDPFPKRPTKAEIIEVIKEMIQKEKYKICKGFKTIYVGENYRY